MARIVADAWIPIEKGSNAFAAIQTQSAVERLSRHEPMASDTKDIPRSVGVDVPVVAKGAAYTEAGGTESVVTLRARKFASAVRIAEEDLQDAPANIIAAKQVEWANGYARFFDNAALGTSAVANGTTVPFNSVYYTVTTADASVGYSANANLVQSGAATAPTYAQFSQTLAAVEQGDYFGDLVVIAHPRFKSVLRNMVDSTGSPLFVQGLAGTPDTIFGNQIAWSVGAAVSATNTRTPTGNPLLIVANRNALVVGDRLAPQTTVIPGFQNNLTDETLLKGRARKGFVVAHPNAVAVLEYKLV